MYLGIRYKGALSDVTLPTAVKIIKGRFSYNGRSTITYYVITSKGVAVNKVRATTSVTGRFTSAKSVRLSFVVKKDSFRAAGTKTLKLSTTSQT